MYWTELEKMMGLQYAALRCLDVVHKVYGIGHQRSSITIHYRGSVNRRYMPPFADCPRIYVAVVSVNLILVPIVLKCLRNPQHKIYCYINTRNYCV